MTALTFAPAPELRRRIRPSREQLRIAAAMLAAAPEDVTSVVVPIVMSGADSAGLGWNERLDHPGGYWLADRSQPDGRYGYRAARQAAEAAAEAHLDRHDAVGVAGWVSIRTDGTWVAFDGFTEPQA